MITPYLYWPLVDALFPDYGRRCDPKPLSGLRAFDAALVRRPLPPGYGVETFLNLTFAEDGHAIATEDLGFVGGPLRAYGNVQESAPRSSPRSRVRRRVRSAGAALRPEWDAWVGRVLDAIGVPPVPGAPADEHLAAVAEVATRPFPPARAESRAWTRRVPGPHGSRRETPHPVRCRTQRGQAPSRNGRALALEAAKPGDRVWFVDSASEDDSIAVARGSGSTT